MWTIRTTTIAILVIGLAGRVVRGDRRPGRAAGSDDDIVTSNFTTRSAE